MAVNAFNEPKSRVESFVTKNGYKQRVLLNGGLVASTSYGLRAFPVSFLVDREGQIVKGYRGFSPGSAPKKERDIAELVSGKS